MSKRRDAKRDAHQASLVEGSLYLQENMDFITKTYKLAKAVHEHLSKNPDYKENPLRLEIATLRGNLRDLELEMQLRFRRHVRIEKRKLEAMEDGWMFSVEEEAIRAIATEDLITEGKFRSGIQTKSELKEESVDYMPKTDSQGSFWCELLCGEQ